MHQVPHPVAIGAAHLGGFYGGQINVNGIVLGIIWAPKAEGQTKGLWLPSDTDLQDAASYCDSMANTVAMAEAGSEIANWARALTIGGHTDWCLPARDVLEIGYRYLKPSARENWVFRNGENPSAVPPTFPYTETSPAQTSVTEFQAGGGEAFDEAWYWASTQQSEGDAWNQNFNFGYQLSYDKSFEARARAVRRFSA